MNKKELDFILQEGEGFFIEFKEGTSGIDKDIVAFANAQGGRIFLGIDDKNNVKGIDITNRLKSQIQDIANNCEPKIKISFEEYNHLLIVHVEEGNNKPYLCSAGFYLRQGPSSQKLSREEILSFSIEQGKISFDAQINSEFNFDDLDENKLNDYLNLANLTKNVPTEDILLNLKVAKNKMLNNAGILFFSKDPGKYFLTSKVVCVNYQTNEKVNILDKKIFDDGLISNIKESIDYVSKHINVKYEIKSAKRKEILQYPIEAYREAIVNAIMHRDYFDDSGDILVEIFRNKIIISNPGGLVKWLKEEDFGKYSKTRNPIIAELLSKTEYVEKLGSGINRIRAAMQNAGLKPVFEYNSTFAVILVGEKVPEKVPEKRLETIIIEIKKNNKMTIQDLALVLNVNEKTVKRDLEKLKGLGKISRVGPAKGGHWKVK